LPSYLETRLKKSAQKYPNLKELIDKMDLKDLSLPVKLVDSDTSFMTRESNKPAELGRVQIARILLQQRLKKRKQQQKPMEGSKINFQ
jgi:hypothetical protein